MTGDALANLQEENYLLRDQIKDHEVKEEELWETIRELKTRLGELDQAHARCPKFVSQTREGWVEVYRNGEWVRDHEVVVR